MRRFLLFVAVWSAATISVGVVAWAVVGLAGEQIAEDAVMPLSAREVEALAQTTMVTEPASQGTVVTVPDDGAVTSTVAPGADTAPSTTASTSVTTTLPSAGNDGDSNGESEVQVYQVVGGAVVIRFSGGTIDLVSASPSPGFFVEVSSTGPERIEVSFEGNEVESKFRAEVSGGEVIVTTEVEED